MKMKKTILTALAIFSIVLSGCGKLTTESEANAQNRNEEETVPVTQKDETITILGTSEQMSSMNVLRDQLEKNGFNVEFNIQPDFASLLTQRTVGNYDILAIGWDTVTGAPDYAVRSLYHSEGDSSQINNPRVDELIDTAATQTPEEYVDTYTQLEELLIEENAYTAPLYTSYKPIAYNHEVLNSESIPLYKAREIPWNRLSFNDESKNSTEPVVLHQSYAQLTSMDPIQANDASVSKINSNMYTRLVNLDENDQVTSEGSLSYNHAIGEGNQEYYFVLRDDINFAAVEDGQATDTGVMVSGNDAVFSVNRMAEPNSVPDHRTTSLFSSIEGAELVTDMSELENTTVSGGDQTVMDSLQQGLETPIQNLVQEDSQVNNNQGNYQVVKVTTAEPFPQILNNLSHASAGIVSEEQVKRVNDFKVSEYNPNVHTAYGDQAAVTPGPSYNNHLWASGPYIMLEKNNTQASFQKNPAFMPDTQYHPKINEVSLRLITDPTSSLSAFRSGEIDLITELPATKYEVVRQADHLTLEAIPSNAVNYIQFNLSTPGKPTTESANFRKAVMYSINQEEMAAVNSNNVLPAYSTLTPVIDTGNTGIEASRKKVEHYYQQYQEGKQNSDNTEV